MADKRIDELVDNPDLVITDFMHTNKAGVDSKITLNELFVGDSESFTDTDTTPSVLTGQTIYSFVDYTGIATITDFEDGVTGQRIELFNPTANAITITDGANIQLSGSVNFVMNINSSLTLRKTATIWYEVSRST